MKQHLQIFVAVVERKSFSRAAEELHMTQPAVSQYIRALEGRMGVKLLDRTNKYVQLNKAGAIVYYHAKEILGIYTKMHNLVGDLTEKAQGNLSIGASYTYGEYVLPRILTVMQKEYPKVEPAVTIGNTATIAELVAGYQLDVGIVEGHFKIKDLFKEKIAEDELVIIAPSSHPFAKKSHVAHHELEREPWIIREQGSGTREATEKMFQQLRIFPRKKLMFSSTQLIKGAVEKGLGISFLSKWTINKEINNKDLTIINIGTPPFTRDFSVITKSPFQTKALMVFKTLL